MITYDSIKKWCKEHKKEMYVGACFALMFFVGFGTGRYDKEAQSAKRKAQNNYSKNNVNQQKADTAGDNQADVKDGQAAGQTAADGGVSPGDKCLIKGNISSSGKMIYHMPEGAFYKNTNPEKCFNTEKEAKQAGFVKSSR